MHSTFTRSPVKLRDPGLSLDTGPCSRPCRAMLGSKSLVARVGPKALAPLRLRARSTGRMASSTAAAVPALVSPEWVSERLQDPSIKILDASWFMPATGRNGKAEYKIDRVPGSRFFDIDGVATPSAGLPHMVPSEPAFAAAMDVLGITPDTHVVLYDRMGIFSAPRAWWTFSIMGHQKVSVMEGGFPAWKALSLPVDSADVSDADINAPGQAAQAPPATAKYPAKLDTSKVRSLQDMLANISSKAEVVVDARSAGRFVGTEPEPRAGLRGGHIPGALNVPFPMVLEAGPSGNKFKDAGTLKQVFASAGVDLSSDQPLVGSCGSGLTACVLALAVYKASGKLIAVYDGSWMEWGSKPDTPISTEPAPTS